MVIHINYSNILRKDPLSPRVATPFTLSAWFGKTTEVHILLWGSNQRISISAKNDVASVVWKNHGSDTFCFGAATNGYPLVLKMMSLPWFGKTTEATPLSLTWVAALDQNDYFLICSSIFNHGSANL